MSLEGNIAALVTATNALTAQVVGGKIEEINDVLNQAIIDLPQNMAKTFYVDQVSGLDTNNGLTLSTPFKSLRKAMYSCPNQGYGQIFILGNENESYTFTALDKTTRPKAMISLFALTRGGVARKGKLNVPWLADENNLYNIDFFGFTDESPCITSITDLDITIMAEPVGVTLDSNVKIGLFSGNLTAKRSLLQLNLYNCFLQNLSVNGKLFASERGAIALTVAAFTHAGMAGKFINEIASGTAPKDTGRVLSNLATL